MSALDKNKTTLIAWLYLSLGLVQALHSVEEVATGLWKQLPVVTGLIHARFSGFPVLNWTAEGFASANLIVVALILALSPFPFLGRAWAWKVVRVVAVIEVLNGVIHIIPALLKGAYHPGCISAVFLLSLGVIILIKMRVYDGH